MTGQHVLEFQRLAALKKDADRALLQQRGRDFESLMNDIFDDEKLLLRRSFHTDDDRSEQIDGAIEVLNRIFLLEAKWQESVDVAASDLYAFIGKVENKFVGTAGIFISRPPLSDNFLNALNKGRRQSVIVIHGPDIDAIFTNKVLLKDYLEQTIRIISYDNQVHHPVSVYVESQKPLPDVSKANDHSAEANKFISEKIAKNGLTDLDIEEIKKKSTDVYDIVFSYIVNRFGEINAVALRNMDLSVVSRAERFLQAYKPSHSILLSTAENYFSKLVRQRVELYYRDEFRRLFNVDVYNAITQDARDAFEDGLVELYKENQGNFGTENMLTILVDPLWTSLKQETSEKIAWFYLDIFIDKVRYSSFPQKRYATQLGDAGAIPEDVIREWLDEKFKRGLASYEGIADDAERLITTAYEPIAQLLRIQSGQWPSYVHKKLIELQR